MNLLKEIERQERRWNRAKRIQEKQKKKLFDLLRKQQAEAMKRNEIQGRT